MAKRNRLLVPEARGALEQFKTKVMNEEGLQTSQADQIKFEVANDLGIPLQKGYNGHLEAKDAGRIGGKIGGTMVKEMIRIAQENLKKNY